MNKTGYPYRVPLPQHQTLSGHRSHTPRPFTTRHHPENELSLAEPGSLFYLNTLDVMPEHSTVENEAPSADWQELQQVLHQRLINEENEDCAFTLLLPEAGEVDVTLTRGQSASWEIALRFSPRVWHHWQRREIQCRRALSRVLAAPVQLRIEQGTA